MHYLIGDVQGCCDALDRLLAEIGFSPSRDRLHLLGDLVNRGPASLRTLQRLRALGGAATCLLGNHDLHLLAVATGGQRPHRNDTISDILDSPDRAALLEWLRHGKLADTAHGWLLVHAGVVPQWSAEQTLALAAEVQAVLTSPGLADFMRVMYGNQPARWDDALTGHDRWRMVLNVLTRIRYCTPDGTLEFDTKDGSGVAPPGHQAWFDTPRRRTLGVPIAFGHWSTLGLRNRPDLLALDTGCVWGGSLTAVRIDGGRRDVTQVHCPDGRTPF
ncbi:MAG: bis(5'-nucleosyl)-tetraphosphatase (symmetrical) [Burkholderiales bacterium RIFCSPHIGHO2_12_FULL_69_20]|nr:MAG: bis(5'-nucleosyl)-tetraphosphatase (symmetrical) [Burkholderiales bacterium RIFCSPHIGHO2_12_FULL_69_20]